MSLLLGKRSNKKKLRKLSSLDNLVLEILTFPELPRTPLLPFDLGHPAYLPHSSCHSGSLAYFKSCASQLKWWAKLIEFSCTISEVVCEHFSGIDTWHQQLPVIPQIECYEYLLIAFDRKPNWLLIQCFVVIPAESAYFHYFQVHTCKYECINTWDELLIKLELFINNGNRRTCPH